MNFGLRIKHFELPADSLPRYAYARKRTLHFLNRYNKLIHSVGLNDEFHVPTYGTVQVYYIHDETSIDVCIVNAGGTGREVIRCKSLTLKEYMRNWDERKQYFGSVFLTTIKLLERHNNLLGPRIIIIQNANEEIQTIEGNYKTTFTSPDNLQKHIGILLERDVLSILFERVNILQCLVEIKDPLAVFAEIDEETTINSLQLFSKQSEKEAVEWDINNKAQMWLKVRLTGIKKLILAQFANASPIFKENIIESMLNSSYSPIKFPESQMCEDLILSRNYIQSSSTAGETQVPEFVREKVVDLKNILELYQQCEQLQRAYATLGNEVSMQRHVIEQLYGEIQSVFYRSMVPPKERPQVLREMNKVLDEKLAKEIFSLKGVVSAGYRFSTLNIFLDVSMSVDEKERTQDDLTRLLNGHNVLKYVFCYEQTEVTQFRKVGSTIKVHNETICAYREGSLGGFAKLGADKETCVLLAKHLADQSTSSCIYIKDYSNAEAILPFAFILQPRIPVKRNATLDIAIAKVIPSELNNCQMLFKDEYGTSLPSTLCLFNDSAWLNGLDVHIWRAGSSPGLGVIVIPTLYVKDMDDTFLKIEDREPEHDQQITRFAKEGDSGAVVCANDINRSTVHVLAMLIGSSNHFQVTQDPASKQQYVAFRLLNGLQQLRQEQQNDVALF